MTWKYKETLRIKYINKINAKKSSKIRKPSLTNSKIKN